jgi:hypothetical protein
MANKIELIIDPGSEDYNPNDDRWLSQVNDLLEDCKREAGEIRKVDTPEEGKKGGFEEIFLMIDSSQAIVHAFGIFKSWVMRDRTRTLNIKIKVGDEVKEIALSGNGFKKEDLDKYMMLAINLQSNKDG